MREWRVREKNNRERKVEGREEGGGREGRKGLKNKEGELNGKSNVSLMKEEGTVK